MLELSGAIWSTPKHSKRSRDRFAMSNWQSYQIVSPEVAKKFKKMPKSEFWQWNSPPLSNLAKNSPKLLHIGGKVAKICNIFWQKIATSGHSANWESSSTFMPLKSQISDLR